MSLNAREQTSFIKSELKKLGCEKVTIERHQLAWAGYITVFIPKEKAPLSKAIYQAVRACLPGADKYWNVIIKTNP